MLQRHHQDAQLHVRVGLQQSLLVASVLVEALQVAAQQHGEPVQTQMHMAQQQQQQEYDQMMLEGLAVVEQEESNVHHPGRQLVLLALADR